MATPMCSPLRVRSLCCFFFFNDTATTEIYTLSLHDALPILYVDGHKAASDVRDEFVSVTEKLMDENSSRTSDRKSGSAGMPRPISYAVFCLKKKKNYTARPLK